MPPYCGVPEVQALLPQRRYSADTEPSIDQVLLFCRQASAELDVVLTDVGVSTPVVEAQSPVAWAWLAQAAAYGAAMRAENAATGVVERNPRIDWLERQWALSTRALATGAVRFPDAGGTGGVDGSGPGSTTRWRPAARPPWFTRDMGSA